MAHTLFIALQAIRRDGSSGGCCRMAIITKVSWSNVETNKIKWEKIMFLHADHPQPGWRGEEAVVEQRAAHQVLSWDSRPFLWRMLSWPKPPTLMLRKHVICIRWNNYMWQTLVILHLPSKFMGVAKTQFPFFRFFSNSWENIGVAFVWTTK